MFHHVELYRIRPGVPIEGVRRAREELARLAETIPGVLHLSVGHNVADEHGGYKLALFAAFENEKACQLYLRHPDRVRARASFLDGVVDGCIVAEADDEGA